MQVAYINKAGFQQIEQAIVQHHKHAELICNPPMLSAWASVAEGNFSNGSGCYFEIRRSDSNTGCPVEVSISPDGYDIREINDE